MPARKKPASSSSASSYDRFKEFQGQRYTGMAVGRGHKWHYDAGDWTEKKVTPDKWEFRYAVVKRRKGKAPEGSGAPVGTAYSWYILAHQTVTKRDANSYTTDMAGLKYKVAHRRAGKDTWSASDAAQRRRVVAILKEMIATIEKGGATLAATEPAPAAAAATKPKPRRTRAATKPTARATRRTRRKAA
jgi:hypothetical protein